MFSLSSSGKKPDSTNFQYQNQAFCFINHPKSLIDQAKSLNDHPICLNDHPKSLVDEAKSVADDVICFIDEVNRVMDEGFRVDLEISWILIIYLVLITADNSKSNVPYCGCVGEVKVEGINKFGAIKKAYR